MKNEKIKEFLTRLAQEEGFKDEFLELKEKVEKKGFSNKDNEKFISECLLPWSKKLGYKLSKKDFIDFDRTQKPTDITGLSPVELENVSGGGFTMLLALFATFGSALAGFAGGGGTTGNNAKTNNNFDSTDLTFSYSSPVTSNSSLDFSSYGSSDVNNKYLNSSSVVSSGSSYALTDDQDYLSSLNVTEGAENTNKANSTRTFAGNGYSFESDDLLQDAPSNVQEPATANQPVDTAPGTTPASVPGGGSDALDASFQTAGASQQTSLAGNVSQYGENIGASSSTSNGAPEGFNVSTTSSTLGGQETINMLKDIPAAENANFKAFGTQAEQSGGSGQVSTYTGLDSSGHEFTAAPAGGESMSTAPEPKPSTWRESPASTDSVVSEQAQPGAQGNTGPIEVIGGGTFPALNPGPGVFSRFASWWRDVQVARSKNKENIDTDKKTNFDGFERTPEEIEQHNYENYGKTSAEDYDKNYARTSPGDYESNYGETPADFGPSTAAGGAGAGAVSDWTKDPENFNNPIEGAENQSEADFNNHFAGRDPIYTQPGLDSTVGMSADSAPARPLGYSQSSAGSGSVGSEQTQTTAATQDLNITTGFAGGGTPAASPVLNQINTTQGNATLNATQNNTTSNTTSESFTSSSSQNGQSWKDFAKQAATGAAGIIAAVGVPTAIAVGLSKLPDNAAQQNNTDKTKGTSKKTEDKKSTKETKKDGSDFMLAFKADLNPLTIQYLESLK